MFSALYRQASAGLRHTLLAARQAASKPRHSPKLSNAGSTQRLFGPQIPPSPHFTGMEITFLGSSSATPTQERGLLGTCVRMPNGKVWLFDCGEGIQRQFLWSHLSAVMIQNIFITHMHGDHVWGLPGLLCSSAFGSQEEKREPLRIFGPRGLKQFLRASLVSTYTNAGLPYEVHELVPGQPQANDVYGEELDRIFPAPKNEQPGSYIYPDADGVFRIFDSKLASIVAKPIKHTVPCFGYVITEADHEGTLDVEKALALGMTRGPLMGDLKSLIGSGQSVKLPDGRTIHPSQVVGPARPGRKVTILGDTYDASNLTKEAMNSDVIVHESTFSQDMAYLARERGHSTPETAGRMAKAINAKTLILNHFSARFTGQEGRKAIDAMIFEASKHTSSSVLASYDWMSFGIPPPKP